MKKFALIIILKAFCFFLDNSVYSQSIICTVPEKDTLPAMFVYREVADVRKMQFYKGINSKINAIHRATGFKDSFITYNATAVDELMKTINKGSGIRIYFAKYAPATTSVLKAPIEKNRLILLFAKEPLQLSEPNEYYFLNPDGRDTNPYTVKKVDAEEWIKNYNTNVQIQLRNGLVPNDRDNVDKYDNPRIYNDTKSIFYSNTNISEAFTKEVNYQDRVHGLKVTAYKVTFSSYTSRGDQDGKFKNRLLLQFDYIDQHNKVIDLQTQTEFACRETPTMRRSREQLSQLEQIKEKTLAQSREIKWLKDEIKRTMAVDNGLLCPTNCPPRP